jgi:hypothetical protein
MCNILEKLVRRFFEQGRIIYCLYKEVKPVRLALFDVTEAIFGVHALITSGSCDT